MICFPPLRKEPFLRSMGASEAPPSPASLASSTGNSQDVGEFFLRTPPASVYLKRVLANYPDGTQLMKEGLQNSEDAGASRFCLLLDERRLPGACPRVCGSALVMGNDGLFSKKDWVAFQSMFDSEKAADRNAIGRFGVGSKSYFHMTDVVFVLSGNYLAFIDPSNAISTRGGGIFDMRKIGSVRRRGRGRDKIEIDVEEILETFEGVLGFSRSHDFYDGTIIRLPLRLGRFAESSHFAPYEYTSEKVRNILSLFAQEAVDCLLFLRNVSKIEIAIWPEGHDAPQTAATFTAELPSPDDAGTYIRRPLRKPRTTEHGTDPHPDSGISRRQEQPELSGGSNNVGTNANFTARKADGGRRGGRMHEERQPGERGGVLRRLRRASGRVEPEGPAQQGEPATDAYRAARNDYGRASPRGTGGDSLQGDYGDDREDGWDGGGGSDTPPYDQNCDSRRDQRGGRRGEEQTEGKTSTQHPAVVWRDETLRIVERCFPSFRKLQTSTGGLASTKSGERNDSEENACTRSKRWRIIEKTCYEHRRLRELSTKLMATPMVSIAFPLPANAEGFAPVNFEDEAECCETEDPNSALDAVLWPCASQSCGGKIFSYLPVGGIETGLPVHLNGNFALTENRRNLWLSSASSFRERDRGRGPLFSPDALTNERPRQGGTARERGEYIQDELDDVLGLARDWQDWNQLLLSCLLPPVYLKAFLTAESSSQLFRIVPTIVAVAPFLHSFLRALSALIKSDPIFLYSVPLDLVEAEKNVTPSSSSPPSHVWNDRLQTIDSDRYPHTHTNSHTHTHEGTVALSFVAEQAHLRPKLKVLKFIKFSDVAAHALLELHRRFPLLNLADMVGELCAIAARTRAHRVCHAPRRWLELLTLADSLTLEIGSMNFGGNAHTPTPQKIVHVSFLAHVHNVALPYWLDRSFYQLSSTRYLVPWMLVLCKTLAHSRSAEILAFRNSCSALRFLPVTGGPSGSSFLAANPFPSENDFHATTIDVGKYGGNFSGRGERNATGVGPKATVEERLTAAVFSASTFLEAQESLGNIGSDPTGSSDADEQLVGAAESISLQAPSDTFDHGLAAFKVASRAVPLPPFTAPSVARVLRVWGLKQNLTWLDMGTEIALRVCNGPGLNV